MAAQQDSHVVTNREQAEIDRVAALTVPLFLNMISSTLLEGARTKPVDLYVFCGFCLIYVVASRRLFEVVRVGRLVHVHLNLVHPGQRMQDAQVGTSVLEVSCGQSVETAHFLILRFVRQALSTQLEEINWADSVIGVG